MSTLLFFTTTFLLCFEKKKPQHRRRANKSQINYCIYGLVYWLLGRYCLHIVVWFGQY